MHTHPALLGDAVEITVLVNRCAAVLVGGKEAVDVPIEAAFVLPKSSGAAARAMSFALPDSARAAASAESLRPPSP